MYFTEARKSNNEWWRYLITIMAVVLAQVVGLVPFLAVLMLKKSQGGVDIQGFRNTFNFETIGVSQNLGLIIMLIPSVLSFFVLLFLIWSMHKRTLGDIASAGGKIRWERVWLGSAIWLFLLISCELIAGLVHHGNYVFHFDLERFLPLLIIAVLMIPFQAGFEELLFRSYLMQGAGLLSRFRIIALLITSIGFGLLHCSNPEVKQYGFLLSMTYYIGFGLFAGLLVVMDNGIELAIGVHAINNIYGAVFVTYESSALQTSALWKMKTLDTVMMNVGFFAMAIVFLIIFARKYRWTDWQKIFRRIS